MPLKQADAAALVMSRHPEWVEFQRHWRWLADSLEGGNRYKHADYTLAPDQPSYLNGNPLAPLAVSGFDATTSQPNPLSYGRIVDRNLVPHLRETSETGKDIYALRLARTPVPRLVGRTVEAHLCKIYGKEVTRKGPPDLEAWWEDVDGAGTPIDRWMDETVAPLLLTLGQLDLCFDHPEAPKGARIETRADQLDAGLTDCVASVILPENMLWWRLDTDRSYLECLVLERLDGGAIRFRHWTATESNAYTSKGVHVPEDSHAHAFGRVPIVRVFDRRKPRCRNVGGSRYEGIAELQKAVYNARSELILGDVQQSCAQLMGPECYLTASADPNDGQSIATGPDAVLPIPPKTTSGTDHGIWAYIDPPKGAQEAIRSHIQDYSDEADRLGALLKPAGMTAASTTGQSGISKIADSQDGNATLARVAEVLANAERSAAELALLVMGDGPVGPAELDAITITYPKQFELYTIGDLTDALASVQQLAASAGTLPLFDATMLKRIIAVALPGLDDETMNAIHAEVDAFIGEAEKARQQEADAQAQTTQAEADLAAAQAAGTASNIATASTPA